MEIEKKEDLFKKMFLENKDRIYRVCYAALNNKAAVDDLFQEVMVNIWKSIDKFRGDAKISTWVYRICVNTSLLFNLKFKREPDYVGDCVLCKMAGKPSFSEPEETERLAVLHQCIAGLKKQDRLIVSLLLDGVGHHEISDITGMTVNYIGVKKMRIKETLSNCVQEAYNG